MKRLVVCVDGTPDSEGLVTVAATVVHESPCPALVVPLPGTPVPGTPA